MGSLEFLWERQLRKKGVAAIANVDLNVGIRLRYVGTGTVTSVTLTAATDVTVITSDGGTDAYTWVAYATMGELVDAINAAGIFEAKLLDTLRSKPTASAFANTGAVASTLFYGETIWDLLLDTSACDYIAYRLCYDRGFERANKNNHRVHLKEIKYLINLSGATASTVTVYDTSYDMGQPKEENAIYSVATVDNTVTTINWRSGASNLTAKEAHDLVVLIPDNDNFTNTAAYLRVAGFIE